MGSGTSHSLGVKGQAYWWQGVISSVSIFLKEPGTENYNCVSYGKNMYVHIYVFQKCQN